eukprot:scaffold8013_cov124-Isochrysis_galbana.AAC.17
MCHVHVSVRAPVAFFGCGGEKTVFSFSHVAWRPAWPPGAPRGGGPIGRDTETLTTPAFSQPACCPKPLKLQCPLRHQVQTDIDTIAAGSWQDFFLVCQQSSCMPCRPLHLSGWIGPCHVTGKVHPPHQHQHIHGLTRPAAGARRRHIVLPRFPGILSTHNPTFFPCPMLSTHMVSHTTCCNVCPGTAHHCSGGEHHPCAN